MRSSHQGSVAISSDHRVDRFQSSTTSWSSNTIAVGTVDSSQRTTGWPHVRR
jgi:hypothetical protein